MTIFLIHGWGGNPEEGWFPWFKEQAEKLGHTVNIPSMPNASEPEIDEWVNYLNKIVDADQETILIGHSIGCQALMRFLENANKRVRKVIFVAGWFILKDLDTEEEWVIAKPWLEKPINFERVAKNAGQIDVFLSDNDSWVPLEENATLFAEKLRANVHILNNKGHLSGEHGVYEFPEILDLIKNDGL